MKKLIYFILLFYYKIEFLFLRITPLKIENSILISKLDNIGDFIIWLDSASEYKKNYEAKIVLLCNQSCFEIAKAFPYFDEIIHVNTKKMLFNPFYRLKLLYPLSKRKFQKIINPIYSRDYFLQDITIKHLRAFEKIGFYGNYINTTSILRGMGFESINLESKTKKIHLNANQFYSMLIPSKEGIIMELNRSSEFIRGLFNNNFQSSLPNLDLKFEEYKDIEEKEYVILFLGASSLNRVWEREKYAYVINKLNENIVVCGGKGEEEVFQEIEKHLEQDKKVINLIGKTSLLELFSLISKAKYLISNDTSASHIAPLVKTPSLVLLPGNYYGRFHPYSPEVLKEEDKKYIPKVVNHPMPCYNCFNICKYGNDKTITWPCISNISVEDVIDKINEIEKEINND
jgi:ADP-heptose:LPS heptosyltransferase